MKWISVEKRLPDKGDKLCVIWDIDHNDYQFGFHGLNDEPGTWDCPDEGWIYNVTHWISLPKPLNP